MTFEAALAAHKAGNIAAAERAYRQIIAREAHADALCNLGLILKDRGEYAEAEALLKRAIAAAPQNRTPIYNLGNLYQQTGRLEEAVPCFRTAIALGAGSPAMLNLGNTLLALGRYPEGWAMYDARPEHANSQAHKLGFPEWRGEPLAGKRLFIWPEQGFGDQILAARFIPLLDAAEITFVCAPELVDLFAQLPATIVPRRGDIAVEPHDYWSIPLSLPRWIGRIPTEPYLKARPRRTGGRIGVAWKGNALPDPLRSLDAEAAERLRGLPGAISLHPEDSGATSFQETAELIAGLDQVITIDTSVAHLAGALGKPTLVLLHHFSSDWRWREGEDGHAFWYPSARVLRQPTPGDWGSVLDAVFALATPIGTLVQAVNISDTTRSLAEKEQLVALARREYQTIQDVALAESPLSAMNDWIGTGTVPPARVLRDSGLTTAGIDGESNAQLRLARMAFTRRWGFSIPCEEAVEALRELSPLLEVGAGSGYWSAILRASGTDVIATDSAAEGINPHGFQTSAFTPVERLDATDAIRAYPGRAVFCSWPTEGETWAAEAFALIAQGNILALVGDDRGGITGSDALFDLLESDFELLRELEIPQFPRVTDRLRIYRRYGRVT